MSKRKTSKATGSAKTIADLCDTADPQNFEARLAASRAEAAVLRNDAKALRIQLGDALEFGDRLCEYATAIKPPPIWKSPVTRGKPIVHLVALLSDPHTGEVTDLAETDGWGIYNPAILEQRLGNYATNLLKWTNVQRGGYDIKNCHVVLLGDMVSGDIHPGLTITNACPVPMQIILAGRVVAGFVASMAAHFKTVTVHAIAGSNHSRLSRKPQFKQGSYNSYDVTAYEHARVLTRNCKNVQFHMYAAKKQVVEMAGYNWLCGHGDWIRAWMGLPWYGLTREMSREALRRLEKVMEQVRNDEPVDQHFDYVLAAHWHVPFVGPSFKSIINGAVTGTNELDHTLGRHAPPQQVSALVSPEHGLFAPTAWRLDTGDESALKECSAIDMFFSQDVKGIGNG